MYECGSVHMCENMLLYMSVLACMRYVYECACVHRHACVCECAYMYECVTIHVETIL